MTRSTFMDQTYQKRGLLLLLLHSGSFCLFPVHRRKKDEQEPKMRLKKIGIQKYVHKLCLKLKIIQSVLARKTRHYLA